MHLRISFIFVCEGTSDAGLIQHLEVLCVKHGADEAMGMYPDFSRLDLTDKSVSEKVAAALRLEPNANLIFIHRDADAPDPEPRYDDIHAHMKKVETTIKYVAVVRVQETEAWLLIDEAEIRSIAENPKGTNNLRLPRISRIERTANPKEILKTAIADASETSGKRLRKINKKFSNKRRQLLERIDIEGDIEKLSSWQRLRHDIDRVIKELSTSEA